MLGQIGSPTMEFMMMDNLTVNKTLDETISFGGIAFMNTNLWLYVPYLILFSLGIVAGILGKYSRLAVITF